LDHYRAFSPGDGRRDHLTTASLAIAMRILEELRRSNRPLDDDELADRLSVRPRQTINPAVPTTEILRDSFRRG
jgi:hypothetical protein